MSKFGPPEYERSPQMFSSRNFLIDSAMKAAQWERAKGELRALAAIQGSHHWRGERSSDVTEQDERGLRLRDEVEKFIAAFCINGMQEGESPCSSTRYGREG